MIEVEPAHFEQMVEDALDGLPDQFGRLMDNVAVTGGARPGPRGLLGLYEGVPLTSRGNQYAPGGARPHHDLPPGDLREVRDRGQGVAEQVRRTVIHEVAHYFGINDARLGRAGLVRQPGE